MQYNARTVLRLIPNVTPARLFTPYSAFADFDWGARSKASTDRIFNRWQTMEDGEVRAIGRVLRHVHCLYPSDFQIRHCSRRDHVGT